MPVLTTTCSLTSRVLASSFLAQHCEGRVIRVRIGSIFGFVFACAFGGSVGSLWRPTWNSPCVPSTCCATSTLISFREVAMVTVFFGLFSVFLDFFSVLLGVVSCSNSLDCAASQHWLRKYLVLFFGGESVLFFLCVFLLGLRSNCCRFASSYCGIVLSRVAFCFRLALTCCGIALSRVAFCHKVLGESNFEAPVLRQTIGECN